MSREGQLMRTRVGEISSVGRNTKGVVVMRIDEPDEVAAVALAASDH